jgi:sterol 3beta-glucosyltransferase
MFKGPPIMSQMLEAKANMSPRPSMESRRSMEEGDGMTKLAKRLAEIFEFERPEEVIDGEFSVYRAYPTLATC